MEAAWYRTRAGRPDRISTAAHHGLTFRLVARDRDDTLLLNVQLHLWVAAPDMLPTMVDTQNHSVAQASAASHCALWGKSGRAHEWESFA